MALRSFHPCAFRFHTTNIRRVGNLVDGGSSLSGFQDDIETDGGGYLLADFTNGSTRDRPATKAWRALSDIDGGEKVIVYLCAERMSQPVQPIVRRSHHLSFTAPISTASPGSAYVSVGDTALRASQMLISGTSELALVGGELFSIEHPTWGWRAYRVRSAALQPDGTIIITFRSPLREAVASGTALEFDIPCCQMRKTGQTDNIMTDGRIGQCAISFREDMAPPVSS